MRRGNGRIAVLMLCIVTAACTARSGSRGTTRDVDVITKAELAGAGHADAYSLVQSLRPQWLRTRGATSVTSPEIVRVYLDGSLLGGPDQLRQLSTHSINSLRYLDGLEATQRWGIDHGAGAIVVSTLARTR